MIYEHYCRADSKLDRTTTLSLATVDRAEQDHRHRTRGEASMRPGGGEDGRRSQRSSALHAQGECRAARGRLLLSSACEGQLAMLGPSAHRRDISVRT